MRLPGGRAPALPRPHHHPGGRVELVQVRPSLPLRRGPFNNIYTQHEAEVPALNHHNNTTPRLYHENGQDLVLRKLSSVSLGSAVVGAICGGCLRAKPANNPHISLFPRRFPKTLSSWRVLIEKP